MAAPSDRFWVILHSLLRPEPATPTQVDQSRRAFVWLVNEMGVFRRSCTIEEMTILGIAYNHWTEHREAPSFSIMKHFVTDSGDASTIAHLEEFEGLRSSLQRHDVEDLGSLLMAKSKEFEDVKVMRLLKEGITIVKNGAEIPRKDAASGKTIKQKYRGGGDALRYVIEEMDAGSLGGVQVESTTHGTLSQLATRLMDNYDKIVDPKNLDKRPIYTGLPGLDDRVRPVKGNLIGILGYSKAGKTRLARTWIYNALRQGRNAMHYSYEQSMDEELTFYALMHSYNAEIWDKGHGIPLDRYVKGLLTTKERDFLVKKLIPDLRENRSLPGQLLLRTPEATGSWDEVKTSTVVAHHQTPLDILLVDYLTAMPTKGRDDKAYYNHVIQDAKNFALNMGNGDPLLVISPFQAGRDAWREAAKNDGRYEASAAYMYSQIEKAVDKLLYVYSDNELQKESRVKLGCCIHRQGALVDPFPVAVEHGCGGFHHIRNVVSEDLQAEVESALDQL